MDDINFLRFLTAEKNISNLENSMAHELYAGMPVSKARSFIDDFVVRRRQRMAGGDLHLYVHVPFCATRCLYCHCAKTLLISRAQVDGYQRLVARQIRMFAGGLRDTPIASLYFGGGTPSLLPAAVLRKIFNDIHRDFLLARGAQVNFEVNPAGLTREKVDVLGEHRVNRVTVGIQAFDADVLRRIGRPQTGKQVYDAVCLLRALKGVVINIDLMAGLPGHSVASFMKGLRKAIDLSPEIIHINPFCSIQESEYFKQASRVPLLEMFSRRRQMLREAKGFLEKNGYRAKELEAYHRCDSVKNEQQFGVVRQADSILGLGPYAHSRFFGIGAFFARPVREGSWAIRYSGKALDAHFHMAEHLILNLLEGVDEKAFERVFGVRLADAFGRDIDLLSGRKIVARQKGRWVYAGPWTMEGIFEYFSQVKVLYGADILGGLKKKFYGRYHPGCTYGFDHKAFIKKMQDPVFMLMLSRLGF